MLIFEQFAGKWTVGVDTDYDGPPGFDEALGLPNSSLVPLELRVKLGQVAGTTETGARVELTVFDGSQAFGNIRREQGGKWFVGAIHLVRHEMDEGLGGGYFLGGTVTVHDGEHYDSPGSIHVTFSKPDEEE
jgi:hypothetical protein